MCSTVIYIYIYICYGKMSNMVELLVLPVEYLIGYFTGRKSNLVDLCIALGSNR